MTNRLQTDSDVRSKLNELGADGSFDKKHGILSDLYKQRELLTDDEWKLLQVYIADVRDRYRFAIERKNLN